MNLKQSVKGLLQKSANRFGYKLTRLRDTSVALDVFELVMRYEVLADPHFFFVQIGANDGITDDPIRHFVLRHNLRGLLVEPHPVAYKRLVQNYDGQPQLRFENTAIAAEPGTARLWTSGREGDHDYLSSFYPEVIRKHHNAGNHLGHVDVPAGPLMPVLDKHGVRHVSLLQIDTEGYDYQVIRLFDFSRLKPTIVRFEHLHLSTADFEACVRLLAAQGYRMHVQNIDTVAYLQPAPGEGRPT